MQAPPAPVGAALSAQALRPPGAPLEEGGEQTHLPPGKPLSPTRRDAPWALLALPGVPGHAVICGAPDGARCLGCRWARLTHARGHARDSSGAQGPGHGHLSSAMSSLDCHQPLGGHRHWTSHTKNQLRDEPPQATDTSSHEPRTLNSDPKPSGSSHVPHTHTSHASHTHHTHTHHTYT